MSGVRFAAIGLSVMAGALLVSCTAGTPPTVIGAPSLPPASSRPWWSHGITPCTAPALVRARGHVMGAGTCSGQLSVPALKVTLAVGQRIDVHMTGAGTAALPHSSHPSVLTSGAVSPDGATQTYRAARPGQAVLVSDARACFLIRHPEARDAARSCPVAVVTVVP